MKSYTIFQFSVSLLVVLFAIPITAQWQPEIRLTNDSTSSYLSRNNARCIVANNSLINVVWTDLRDGHAQIYHKRSTDAGISWGNDNRLSNGPSESFDPSIAIDGQNLHVVWDDWRNQAQIFYKRSSDGGLSWSQEIPITDSAHVQYPSISVSGQFVHVAVSALTEIYYVRSTDGGQSWNNKVKLTLDTNIVNRGPISIAASGSNVHTVWRDDRNGNGNGEIYYKRSSDNGASWGPDIRLTVDSLMSQFPTLAVNGSTIHVVWEDFRDDVLGGWEIYYKRSLDGGTTWEPDRRFTENGSGSSDPTIAVSDSNVYLIWNDGEMGPGLHYNFSTDNGTSWNNHNLITENAMPFFPSIAVSGSTVHVVWFDIRFIGLGVPEEIYYKHNPTGSITEVNSPVDLLPNTFALFQNYPNPFNPSTKISWQSPVGNWQTLKIYDVLGKEIATLIDELKPAGRYEIDFDASALSSGVYLYRLTAGSFTETKKFILVK